MTYMLVDTLHRAATGDIEAFMAFYDATCADAYRLAYCYLADPEAAAVALVRTYVEACRHADTFDPATCSPRAWLLAVLQGEIASQATARERERRETS